VIELERDETAGKYAAAFCVLFWPLSGKWLLNGLNMFKERFQQPCLDLLHFLATGFSSFVLIYDREKVYRWIP